MEFEFGDKTMEDTSDIVFQIKKYQGKAGSCVVLFFLFFIFLVGLSKLHQQWTALPQIALIYIIRCRCIPRNHHGPWYHLTTIPTLCHSSQDWSPL